MTLNIDGKDCLGKTVTVSYKVWYTIEDLDKVSYAQIRYIYNINSPSEFTIDGKRDSIFGGDEFNLQAKFDDIEFTFNIPFEESYSYI